ncbi:hypothetical protein, partial [Microcoleus sp. B4-C1]|uniref:hypothetical protein n=1 Tax=Microcoleus sp. B4-C1 TaxID=2818660 RepID=UPI002FD18F93
IFFGNFTSFSILTLLRHIRQSEMHPSVAEASGVFARVNATAQTTPLSKSLRMWRLYPNTVYLRVRRL